MTRRLPRRPEGPPKKSAFASLFSAGDAWFSSDSYSVDGVSGKVASFVDVMDATHLLVQASSSLQVAVPSSDAQLASKASAKFLGAQSYSSNRSLAQWAHIHSGEGFTGVLVWVPTSVTGTQGLYGNRGASGEGLQTYTSATNVRSGIYTAAGLSVPDGSNGAISLNTAALRVDRNSSASTPQFSGQVGGAGTPRSGSYAVAVDSNNPADVLSLGSLAGVFFGNFNFRHLFLFRRYLTDQALATLVSYVTADCGAT